MKKYYIVIQFCLALIVFSLIGEDVIPTKVDVEYLEVIQVLGFDELENKVRVTAILKESSQGDGGAQSGGAVTPGTGKILTVEGETYSQAIDILRNITEKYIPISHVEYFIIGDETAKKSLRNVVDFISRTDETRVTAGVLVSQEMTAESFLTKVNEVGTDIVSAVEGVSKDSIAKNYTSNKSVIDVVDMFLQDKIVGVIPYVAVKDKENFKMVEMAEEPKETPVFTKNSLGIISDMKVVDSLSFKEAEAYNITINEVTSIMLTVKLDENTYVLAGNTENFKLRFKTNDNSIQSVVLYLEYTCDIDEVHSKKPIFDLDTFGEIQTDAENQIEEKVINIITKSKEMNLDFMNLNKPFEIQHPYVYRKIKSDFFEYLKKADIEVNVECRINNTYDVLESNRYQKEGQ
ncbi:MAG: hypothetical protein IKV94_03430 [Clostridia bacterium]|nr:hypothetical protein [Clostridia bacterium]